VAKRRQESASPRRSVPDMLAGTDFYLTLSIWHEQLNSERAFSIHGSQKYTVRPGSRTVSTLLIVTTNYGL
jgi:hypothetical protein